MALTDRSEWILYDTDLTTRLRILPVISGHVLLEVNTPGSGSVSIPLDSEAAGVVTAGMFVENRYRGDVRAGFFIENTEEDKVNTNEDGGRMMSLSGNGAASILKQPIVWEDGSGEGKRTFTGATKASILIDLLEEAQARGDIPTLTWDFTDTDDSDSEAWDDSEDLDITVGDTLLDVIQGFASTSAFDFAVTLVAGEFVLSLYKNGIGENKSGTVFFRAGGNCREIKTETRSDEIINAYLVKYGGGYITVKDDASITAYSRREKIINLEVAQSAESASTYAAALLERTKDPKTCHTLQVFDGLKPYIFEDYIAGDTVTYDVKGTLISHRIIRIQADYQQDQFANVTVEMDTILNDGDLRRARDLDWLMRQWNTARDSNLLEVRRWVPLAHPADVISAIYDTFLDGRTLWVAGAMTNIGGMPSSEVVSYDMETGLWSNFVAAGAVGSIRSICVVGGVLYIGRSAITGSILQHWNGTAWVTDATSSDFYTIYAMVADGTDLYVGGQFIDLDGVTGATGVCRYDTLTGTVHALGSGVSGSVFGLAWDDAQNRLLITGNIPGDDNIVAYDFDSSSYVNFGAGVDDIGRGVAVYGNGFVVVGDFTDYVAVWDNGSSAWTSLPGLDDIGRGVTVFLSDIYVVGDFTEGVQRYSGGIWYSLSGGLDGEGYAIQIDGNNIIVGGDNITNAGGVGVNQLCMYITTFDDLLDHIARSSNTFDMAAAIHAAPSVTSPTDLSSIPLWSSVTQLLGKITFANLWTWIKGKIESVTLNLGGSSVNPFTGSNTFNMGASGASPAQFLTAYGASFAPFITMARTRGTPGSETAVLADDVIGRLRARAHDGSAWSNTQAEIRAVADDDWDGSSHPVRYEIYVTPVGSTTLTHVLTITPDGDMYFVEDTQGVVLKDRTSGDYYRLYVDSGVLSVEAV